MKKIFLISFLIAIICQSFAQNYDLIVISKGDSIACYIDSITSSKFFYRMKYAGVWVSTSVDKNEVAEVQPNAINKKDFVFKSGSSVIDYSVSEISTMQNINKNAVFLGFAVTALTLNYEHIFAIKENIGFSLRGGMGYDFYNKNFIIMGEANFLFGGVKSYFELGLGYQVPAKFPGFIIVRPGYRYQSLKGFLFKAYPMYFYNLDKDGDWDHFGGLGVAFGYTF